MIEGAVGVIVGVAGTVFAVGAAGIGLAWLNDRRHDARERRQPSLDAKQLLELRYAEGSISEEEFDRRMHRLVYGPPFELPHTD